MAKDRSAVGRMSKQKGKAYERHVCDVFNQWAGEKVFSRHWSGRNEAPEKGDVLKPDWFKPTIECRKRENWNMEGALREGWVVAKWYAELKEKAKGGLMLLVFSRNGQPDFLMWGAEEETWMGGVGFGSTTLGPFSQALLPKPIFASRRMLLMLACKERREPLRVCLLKDWLQNVSKDVLCQPLDRV